MPPVKRSHDVIEIFDSDSEDELLPSHAPRASKAPRVSGTHDDPIDLAESDESDNESEPPLPTNVGRVANAPPLPRQQIPEPLAPHPAPAPAPDDEMFAPLEEFNGADFDYWDPLDINYDQEDQFGDFPVNAIDELEANNGAFLIDQLEEAPRPTRKQSLDLPNGHAYNQPGNSHRHPSPARQLPERVDENECLARTLEMFPDIAHDYVADMHKQCSGLIQQVLDKIIDDPKYPKERDRAKEREPSQRQSTAEAEEIKFMQQGRDMARGKMKSALLEILKSEFPKIPVFYIERTRVLKEHLYPTYMALVEAQNMEKPPYTKAPWRAMHDIDFSTIAQRYGLATAALEEELAAAKKARVKWEAQRRKEAAQKREEESNIERSKAIGAVAECATCFDESPLNRMIYCNADMPHFTCYGCAAMYIASEVGQSRCRITCPDSSNCNGNFTETQLRLVPDEDLVEKLLKLQQEQDVRDAGVDDVVECPFCDYKQVCPPLDVDFEFRCQKPECSITSCRKCQEHTHIPLTCEQFAQTKSKDAALEQRHKIEEAMTAALVRNCTRCKKPFIKDFGCNKMTCPSCGNLQCYVCSESVTDYNHFHKRGGCPLHDNVEERHAQEVKKAEAEARAKIEADNPLVNKEGLEFELSETVKKDEETAERRRRQMGAAAGGGNAGFANYAAIFGANDALGDDLVRQQRDLNVVREQRALQQQINARRLGAERALRGQNARMQPPQLPQPLADGLGERLRRLHQEMADIEQGNHLLNRYLNERPPRGARPAMPPNLGVQPLPFPDIPGMRAMRIAHPPRGLAPAAAAPMPDPPVMQGFNRNGYQGLNFDVAPFNIFQNHRHFQAQNDAGPIVHNRLNGFPAGPAAQNAQNDAGGAPAEHEYYDFF